RAMHLVLQARRTAVPEQERAESHVPQRRRMARQGLASDAFARHLAVGEGEARVMAGGTGDRAGGRQRLVLEQAPAERDLLGRGGIAGWLRDEPRPGELLLQSREAIR